MAATIHQAEQKIISGCLFFWGGGSYETPGNKQPIEVVKEWILLSRYPILSRCPEMLIKAVLGLIV